MTLGVLPLRPGPDLRAFAREPTSALQETLLFRAYRVPWRIEACACGGEIEAYGPGAIGAAVGTHNQTPEHTAWAIAAGLR